MIERLAPYCYATEPHGNKLYCPVTEALVCVCAQVHRRQLTDRAVTSSSRSSKKLMSKLLKYHVIGGAVDSSQQTSGSSPGNTAAADAKPVQPQPTRTEPDIFQLPPLPSTTTQETSEAASSRYGLKLLVLSESVAPCGLRSCPVS